MRSAASVAASTVAQLSYQFEQLLLRRRAELAGGNHVEANGIVVMGKAGSGKTFVVEHVIGALQGSGVLGKDEVYSFVAPSPLQSYVLNRLIDRSPTGWLDQISIEAIQRFCEAFSKVLHKHDGANNTDALDHVHPGRAFQVLAAGPIHLRDVLLGIRPSPTS